jgi:hypothetical protein
MPTNRTTIDRPRRTAAIPREAVELFRKLESASSRQRKSDEFRAQDKALHRLLGLGYERIWAAAASVLDRRQPLPTDYPAEITYKEAMRAFSARTALIEAVAAARSEKALSLWDNFALRAATRPRTARERLRHTRFLRSAESAKGVNNTETL